MTEILIQNIIENIKTNYTFNTHCYNEQTYIKEYNQLVTECPFLLEHPDYLFFIKKTGGCDIESKSKDLMLGFYGFGIHEAYNLLSAPPFDEDGFSTFGELVAEKQKNKYDIFLFLFQPNVKGIFVKKEDSLLPNALLFDNFSSLLESVNNHTLIDTLNSYFPKS